MASVETLKRRQEAREEIAHDLGGQLFVAKAYGDRQAEKLVESKLKTMLGGVYDKEIIHAFNLGLMGCGVECRREQS